jgi:hypothetical protein
MSVYELVKLAQKFEREQYPKGADVLLLAAQDLDKHIKSAAAYIEKLQKFARDFQPVTTMPQGNPAGYPQTVKDKLPNMVAAMKALAELHQEVSEQAINGQGALVAPLIKAYQAMLGQVKSLDKMTWENQTGSQIYNTPVYRAGYPHTPGSTSTTNVGARAGAALAAGTKPKFMKVAQQQSSKQGYLGQTGSDIARGYQQTVQTGKNLMDPYAFDPTRQKYIGQEGTIAPGAYPAQTRPMGGGKDPLISGGVVHGLMPDEQMTSPEANVYWNLGGYSQMAPEAVAQNTAIDPENLAYSTVGPILLEPLFKRFKELFVAHGGTPPKDDRQLNDIYLVGAQNRSGLTLNEIAKRGIQLVTNALFRPQLTAAEGVGSAVGQGAGVVGNLAGTMMNRVGPPVSGISPAITNAPYGP